jgi:hypothetical protein
METALQLIVGNNRESEMDQRRRAQTGEQHALESTWPIAVARRNSLFGPSR